MSEIQRCRKCGVWLIFEITAKWDGYHADTFTCQNCGQSYYEDYTPISDCVHRNQVYMPDGAIVCLDCELILEDSPQDDDDPGFDFASIQGY